MSCSGRIKYTLAFLVGGLLTVTLVSNTWAHSGHKDENKPQISLPEVLATVNGTEIKKDIIVKELERAISFYKTKGMPLTSDQEKSAAKKILQDEIGRTLLIQKARETGANVPDATVEQKLAEIKSSFPSEAVFEHKLSDEGMTPEQYRQDLKTDLMIEQVIDKEVTSRTTVSPEEMKTFYEQNKDKLRSPDKRRASVILIKLSQDDSPARKKLVTEKLESVREQVVAGADFAALAKRFSQDSLASKGGDLGYFTKKEMFPAFSSRAFKMDVGEVSEVFQTGHGLHLLKVTDKKPGELRSFEEEKDTIQKNLMNQKSHQATQKYVDGLSKKADIKTYF